MSRLDPTARRFLRAATQLIDAYLGDQPGEARPARLRSIRFPAALEWLRTEDVIRTAAADGSAGASRKAFFNRWPTREEFLPDAVVYALVHDEVPEPPHEQAKQVPGTAAAPPHAGKAPASPPAAVLRGHREVRSLAARYHCLALRNTQETISLTNVYARPVIY